QKKAYLQLVLSGKGAGSSLPVFVLQNLTGGTSSWPRWACVKSVRPSAENDHGVASSGGVIVTSGRAGYHSHRAATAATVARTTKVGITAMLRRRTGPAFEAA